MFVRVDEGPGWHEQFELFLACRETYFMEHGYDISILPPPTSTTKKLLRNPPTPANGARGKVLSS